MQWLHNGKWKLPMLNLESMLGVFSLLKNKGFNQSYIKFVENQLSYGWVSTLGILSHCLKEWPPMSQSWSLFFILLQMYSILLFYITPIVIKVSQKKIATYFCPMFGFVYKKCPKCWKINKFQSLPAIQAKH